MSIKFRTARSALVIALVSTFLVACLEKSDGSGGIVNNPPPPPSSQNRAPAISGQPPSSVMMGQPYDFTPTASDADNDPLTFSVSGLPEWASFSSTTGRVSGTPTLSNIGVTSGISIAVSDGRLSSSLPVFSIAVNQAALGSVTLSWTAPTTNSDGSALVDLIGYKIYYGLSFNNQPTQITLNSPGTTMHVVEDLAPNTYFFAATSIRAGGIESEKSEIAQITVN